MGKFEAILRWVGEHLVFRHFCMLFLMCLAFIFERNPVVRYLGTQSIPLAYDDVIVGCLAITTGGMIFTVLEKIWISISSAWKTRMQQKAIQDHLRNPPKDQKQILLRYAQERKGSLLFDEYNGAVCDLVRRGILYRSSDVAHQGLGVFPYTLTDSALRFIQQPEFQKALRAEETQ